MRVCSQHRVSMVLARTLVGFLYYACPVEGCTNVRSCKLYEDGKRVRGKKRDAKGNIRPWRIPGDSIEDFKL